MKKLFSTVSQFEHSQLHLDQFLEREIKFISTDEKLFTVAPLWTHKMIWFTLRVTVATKKWNRPIYARVSLSASLYVRSLLHCRNWVIPKSFSLKLWLKSMDGITKKCCWCRKCCQWDSPFINPDMWPANSPDLNPVCYGYLRRD